MNDNEFSNEALLKNSTSKKTVKKAGLLKRTKRRKYTSQQLLDYLKELAIALGHTPSCKEINAPGTITCNMYITAFGSVHNGHQLAGLQPNAKYNSIEHARRRKDYVTKEECMEDIKGIYIKLGGVPTITQIEKHGKYPFNTYYRRLGGLRKIRKMSEFMSA